MTSTRRWFVWALSLGAALLSGALAHATTLQTLNLESLVQRADKVFRGTVLNARVGTVEVGGGRLPMVTYRIQVDESFKGAYETVKGVRVADVRMLGRPDPVQSGNLRLAPVLRDVPALKVGETYLLMTTVPSAVGLSTTVGLGQGAFRISGKGGDELAVNEYQNANLFAAPDAADAGPAQQRSFGAARAAGPGRGPVLYSELATQIRALVGGN